MSDLDETDQHVFVFRNGPKLLADCTHEELLEVIKNLLSERRREREYAKQRALRSTMASRSGFDVITPWMDSNDT